MNRPIIGITTLSADQDYFDRLVRNYWWAVTWAGGEPVILTPQHNVLAPEEQVARLDGLLLSGGGDVHPRHYGQPLNGSDPDNIDESRDELELPLARAALTADLPILAICRGMQVLNIVAGGSLIQHVDGHRSTLEATRYHHVQVLPGTLLANTLDAVGSLCTNTFHHQALTEGELAPGFSPSAFVDDRPQLVEGMEGQRWRWVLAWRGDS